MYKSLLKWANRSGTARRNNAGEFALFIGHERTAAAQLQVEAAKGERRRLMWNLENV